MTRHRSNISATIKAKTLKLQRKYLSYARPIKDLLRLESICYLIHSNAGLLLCLSSVDSTEQIIS